MLQFINDLHSAVFRCTGNRTTGERSFQKVHHIFSIFQCSLNIRHQMKYCGICFHCKKLGYFHASRCTYPVQIISFQVYDHEKFTFIFAGICKFLAEHLVFLRRCATFSCSFYGTCVYMTVFHFQKAFRRGTDDLIISKIQISTKRRGIVFPEIIENIQRLFFAFNGQLLCHIGNVDITFYNILDHPVHCLLVFFFLKVWMDLDLEFLTVRIPGIYIFPCFRFFLFPVFYRFQDCFFHCADLRRGISADSI